MFEGFGIVERRVNIEKWLKPAGLLKGPDLQTVDVEVLLAGEWLVVEGGAFGGGAPVQLGI